MLLAMSKLRKTGVAALLGVAFVAGALLFVPAPAEAGGKGNKKKLRPAPSTGLAGTEKKDTGKVISGDIVDKKVDKIEDKIDWIHSFDEAKSLAQKQHKPIFWLHVLGEPDGDC